MVTTYLVQAIIAVEFEEDPGLTAYQLEEQIRVAEGDYISLGPYDGRIRSMSAAGSATVAPALCRCGRPAYVTHGASIPRCPGCEYMAAETCDCVPLPRRAAPPAARED